jgi:hypothetical protein
MDIERRMKMEGQPRVRIRERDEIGRRMDLLLR